MRFSRGELVFSANSAERSVITHCEPSFFSLSFPLALLFISRILSFQLVALLLPLLRRHASRPSLCVAVLGSRWMKRFRFTVLEFKRRHGPRKRCPRICDDYPHGFHRRIPRVSTRNSSHKNSRRTKVTSGEPFRNDRSSVREPLYSGDDDDARLETADGPPSERRTPIEKRAALGAFSAHACPVGHEEIARSVYRPCRWLCSS